MNLPVNTPLSNPTVNLSLDEISSVPWPRNHINPLTDDALVSRIRAGDAGAFEELVGRHEGNLLRLAQRFVHNQHDAQDVLQDVFVATWRKLATFEDRAQIGSWLYRVTVNASLMHLRVRKRKPACVNISPSTLSGSAESFEPISNPAFKLRPDEQLESRELQRVIENAVDKLPILLRSVFLAREIQGYSTRQTAQSLGLSESSVKTRLHRARHVLREKIGGYLLQ
jgi:RNA polymerase sigma-70 factor, ECF subfamily